MKRVKKLAHTEMRKNSFISQIWQQHVSAWQKHNNVNDIPSFPSLLSTTTSMASDASLYMTYIHEINLNQPPQTPIDTTNMRLEKTRLISR